MGNFSLVFHNPIFPSKSGYILPEFTTIMPRVDHRGLTAKFFVLSGENGWRTKGERRASPPGADSVLEGAITLLSVGLLGGRRDFGLRAADRA